MAARERPEAGPDEPGVVPGRQPLAMPEVLPAPDELQLRRAGPGAEELAAAPVELDVVVGRARRRAPAKPRRRPEAGSVSRRQQERAGRDRHVHGWRAVACLVQGDDAVEVVDAVLELRVDVARAGAPIDLTGRRLAGSGAAEHDDEVRARRAQRAPREPQAAVADDRIVSAARRGRRGVGRPRPHRRRRVDVAVVDRDDVEVVLAVRDRDRHRRLAAGEGALVERAAEPGVCLVAREGERRGARRHHWSRPRGDRRLGRSGRRRATRRCRNREADEQHEHQGAQRHGPERTVRRPTSPQARPMASPVTAIVWRLLLELDADADGHRPGRHEREPQRPGAPARGPRHRGESLATGRWTRRRRPPARRLPQAWASAARQSASESASGSTSRRRPSASDAPFSWARPSARLAAAGAAAPRPLPAAAVAGGGGGG